MYDYMRALEDRFTPTAKNVEQRQELEEMCQAVSALLDKQGRKKLLRLVDAHTMVQEEMALSGFITGFRLAWGIAMELGADGSYSYELEQERINCLKNYGAVNKESGREGEMRGKAQGERRKEHPQA